MKKRFVLSLVCIFICLFITSCFDTSDSYGAGGYVKLLQGNYERRVEVKKGINSYEMFYLNPTTGKAQFTYESTTKEYGVTEDTFSLMGMFDYTVDYQGRVKIIFDANNLTRATYDGYGKSYSWWNAKKEITAIFNNRFKNYIDNPYIEASDDGSSFTLGGNTFTVMEF